MKKLIINCGDVEPVLVMRKTFSFLVSDDINAISFKNLKSLKEIVIKFVKEERAEEMEKTFKFLFPSYDIRREE